MLIFLNRPPSRKGGGKGSSKKNIKNFPIEEKGKERGGERFLIYWGMKINFLRTLPRDGRRTKERRGESMATLENSANRAEKGNRALRQER